MGEEALADPLDAQIVKPWKGEPTVAKGGLMAHLKVVGQAATLP